MRNSAKPPAIRGTTGTAWQMVSTICAKEVANRYEAQFGVSLDPDQEVVATIGSEEAYTATCAWRSLRSGRHGSGVPAPSFPIHIHAVALASANVISLDVRVPSVFLANVVRICESLYPRPNLGARLPHNPTAVVVDQPFFEEVVALAKKYRFFVIHDFAYGDLGFDGFQPPSFLSVKGAKSVGCEFTTMSKGYNMAGWRVGFAAGNRDMLGALKAIKGYYDYGIFQAVQVAAIVALRNGEEARLAQVSEYQMSRDTLVRGLKRWGGTSSHLVRECSSGRRCRNLGGRRSVRSTSP